MNLDFGNPVSQPPPPTRTAASSDPWGAPAPATNDPWGAASAAAPSDPWSPVKNNQTEQQQQQPQNLGAVPRASPLPNLGAPQAGAGAGASNDPWSPIGGSTSPNPTPSAFAATLGAASNQRQDAWSPNNLATGSGTGAPQASIDPFSPTAQRELAEFDLMRNEIDTVGQKNGGTTSPNPFDLGGMSSAMPTVLPSLDNSNGATGAKPKKTVQSLLGEHSNLVNLDNLVTDTKTQGNNGGASCKFLMNSADYMFLIISTFSAVRNPFEQHPPNPFQAAQKAQKPAMNQLLQQQTANTWSTQSQQQSSQNSNQAEFNPFF